MVKKGIISLNAVVLILFLWMGYVQQSYEQGSAATLPLEGYQAPSFTLTSFEEEEISFTEDLLGKPLFINFWASWCPPCKAEMPDMVEVAHQYEGKVQFVGINVATQDSHAQALQFIEQYNVPYVNLIDDGGAVSRLYQVPPVPATLVIDENGEIVYRKIGGLTKREMITAIEQALRGGQSNAQ